jgi:hypothetical protein
MEYCVCKIKWKANGKTVSRYAAVAMDLYYDEFFGSDSHVLIQENLTFLEAVYYSLSGNVKNKEDITYFKDNFIIYNHQLIAISSTAYKEEHLALNEHDIYIGLN